MISTNLQNGSGIASTLRIPALLGANEPGRPQTTGDLLAVLAPHPMRSLPMLKTTCGLLGHYLDLPGDRIPLGLIDLKRGGFRLFLRDRHYAENTIRTYVNQVRILLKAAVRLGWDPDDGVSEEWKPLLEVAVANKIMPIVKYFSRTTRTPMHVTIEDVDCWGAASLGDGLSHATVVMQKGRFWRLLASKGMTSITPPNPPKCQGYGMRLDQLDARLQREVGILLKWKQAEFAPNRPKRGKIRAISAQSLQDIICQLAGYVLNVRGVCPTSFMELIQRQHVEGFVGWVINERGVKGRSIKSRIGMIAAVAKNHSSLAGKDFSWFKTLADSIPLEDESERKNRKATRYLDHEILETIPKRIRTERSLAQRRKQYKRALCLASEELLMKWLSILPWRQRNIRECRIGGPNPNIFESRIKPFSDIDKPSWVVEEQAKNPHAEFWQFCFSPAETKTGIEVHALLPKQLINPLEEYLTECRPLILDGRATVNLFLNSAGLAIRSSGIRSIVGKWSFKCGGVRMNPHLARDSFAFRWLKEHPRDFLLLSKMLWHKNVQTTIQIYGARFNASSGVCALEEWLDKRESFA